MLTLASLAVIGGTFVVPQGASAAQSCAVSSMTEQKDGKEVSATRYTPSDTCRNEPRFFMTNPDCACCGKCELNDFSRLLVEVSRYIFGITGSLALLMFIWGGVRWLSSGGSEKAVTAGRDTLIHATLGIVIIFGAWLLVNFILIALTGTEVNGVAQIFGGTWYGGP
jgi:hypothetical protein